MLINELNFKEVSYRMGKTAHSSLIELTSLFHRSHVLGGKFSRFAN